MKIRIIHEEGCGIRTPNVALSDAETHIAAGDRLALESKVLLAFYRGNFDGWKVVKEGGNWTDYESRGGRINNAKHD